jgi:hypothetical protein
MRTHDGRPEEIGIVVYPGVQQAAVHGLTDLFCIAGTFMSGAQKNEGASLHVTHWSYVGRGVEEMECVYSSDRRKPARPSALILPPTLTDLPDVETSSSIARWLAGQHEQGPAPESCWRPGTCPPRKSRRLSAIRIQVPLPARSGASTACRLVPTGSKGVNGFGPSQLEPNYPRQSKRVESSLTAVRRYVGAIPQKAAIRQQFQL